MKRLVIIAIVYVVVLSMGYMGYNLYMIDKRMETLEQIMQPPVTQPLKQKTPVGPPRLEEERKDYQRGLLPSDTRPIQFPPDWMSDTHPSPIEFMPFSGPAR